MKLAVAALVVAAVAAVVIWDPILGLVRSLDLPRSIPLPDVPEIPWWLKFVIAKGKYILIAIIVTLVAARNWPPSTKVSR